MALVVTVTDHEYLSDQQTFPECPYIRCVERKCGFLDGKCSLSGNGWYCGTHHVAKVTCPFPRYDVQH